MSVDRRIPTGTAGVLNGRLRRAPDLRCSATVVAVTFRGDIDALLKPATDSLADDLEPLAREAQAGGVNNVSKLIERWIDRSERYDVPGESLLLAWAGSGVVGVGGIAWCPDVPGSLRVRRFFVSEAVRRRGIARLLASSLMESGFAHTDTLTCNARASAAAAPFWESMGFAPTDIEGITHRLTLPARA